MQGCIGPYQVTCHLKHETLSGITYFNGIEIAAMVFDPLNDETFVHMASGTIFTMKQSQSEFKAFRKWVDKYIERHRRDHRYE